MSKLPATLLFIFVIISSNAQEYYEVNKVIRQKITLDQLESNKYGQQVFRLLGLENNVDAGRIFLDLKFRLLLKVHRDNNNRLVMKTNFSKVSIDGHINIRDFAIDSLLWPSDYEIEVEIKNGRHVREILKVSGVAFGSSNSIDLTDNYSNGIGEFTVNIKNINFSYTDNNLKKLEDISEKIKYYYSYGIFIDDLISGYEKDAFLVDEATYKIFLRNLEIARLLFNLKKHNFNKTLKLYNRDPIGLLKKEKRIFRFEKRYQTLFNKVVKQNKSESLELYQFCRGYCNLSKSFISSSLSVQPSEALGFTEMALIENTLEARSAINNIIEYYNNNEPVGRSLPDCVFEEFVSLSKQETISENYASALLLLNNANTIKNWYRLYPSELYLNSSADALVGLSLSYLKVGNVALSAGNNDLAYKYIDKAENAIWQNRNILDELSKSDTSFNQFLRLEIKLSEKFTSVGEFKKSLNNLKCAKFICERNYNSDVCRKIDSLICSINNQNISVNILQLNKLLEQFQYPDAYNELMSVKEGIDSIKCTNDDNKKAFNESAYSLFIELLQQAQILIDANQYKVALETLLKVRSIKVAANIAGVNVDSIIQVSAVPVIMDVIEQAGFETWANRLENAKQLSDSAILLNIKYLNNNNTEINELITDLQKDMELRKCLRLKNGYNDAITNARILIKKQNFEEIERYLSKAEVYADSLPECNINNKEVVELRKSLRFELEFYRLYSILRSHLFNKNYDDVIIRYNELTIFHDQHKLKNKGINFPSLEEFIKKQQLPVLTLETAKYFLAEYNADMSLFYLTEFKNQGGKRQDCKKTLSQTAAYLAKRDNDLEIPVRDAISKYTNGDSWYNHFKLVYVKNRYIKPGS